ncbi:hypothetical protein JW992_03265, partial [candidate division KSB1 bacterium]|nr:hypothetical protein [candidate division KSB1 bacterium]
MLARCSPPIPPVSFTSSHGGMIQKLVLVYSSTAEMSAYSLVDILRALPEAEVVVISQFAPDTKDFEAFVRIINTDSLGFRANGRPRLQFLQNPSPFGPWPRDQALVQSDGGMWISRRNTHGLRPLFVALQEGYG